MAWHSSLTLGFTQQFSKTLLAERQHTGALRVQRALYPEFGENEGICHVILLYPPAGIAGGDVLNITVNANTDTHAVLTTPGANKWYGMPALKSEGKGNKNAGKQGKKGEQHLTAQLGENARLEWLPQESIFYHDSHATAINHIYLADTASFIGWEINVLGRQAYQEIYEKGTLSLQTYFWRNANNHTPAKLIFADVLNQQLVEKGKNPPPFKTWFSSKTGLYHQPIFATLWAVPTVEQKPQLKIWTEKLACTINDHELPIVVTHTDEVLLVRYLGEDVRACFSAFSLIRGELRRLMWVLDNHEPRIWAT